MISLKVTSSRIRNSIESSRPMAISATSRIRAITKFYNYNNPDYVIVFNDYFAEDYVVEV